MFMDSLVAACFEYNELLQNVAAYHSCPSQGHRGDQLPKGRHGDGVHASPCLCGSHTRGCL